jgi:uncharacterized protein with ParB-like and HNH nuclease domain
MIDSNLNNLKSISELKEYTFFVEDYQRGYKWGIQQVEELLDDVIDFDRNFDNFYCLQPLVVKELSEAEYELIDGQQRLTTIFIILKCLHRESYKLTYRTRTSSEEFLNDISTLLEPIPLNLEDERRVVEQTIDKAWLYFANSRSEFDNVDNYHFYCAYQLINAWLKFHKESQSFFSENLRDFTKVIWYEQPITEEAEDVFVKFNQGKIELAQAELIKALFVLQINEEKNVELRTFKLNQFAEEWNSIENELQDDSFWFFVSNDVSDNRKANRIDLLFDLLREKPKQSNDKLYSYHLYLKEFTEHKKDKSQPELNWTSVRDLHNQLLEWFEDRKLYHLIGYIVYERIKTVASLHSEFQEAKDKNSFTVILQKFIADYFYKCKNKEKYDLESIAYGDNNKQIISWLVLHNVVSYHITDAYYRFPFDRLKLENGWSLEHIHAQNTDKFETISELLDWIKDIEDLAKDFEKQESFDRTTLDNFKEKLKEDGIQRDNVEIKQLEEKLNEEVAVYFQKDSIKNLCLLDGKTNSSIGNKFFGEKRRQILEIDKMSLNEYNSAYHKNDKVKPFIPLATKHTFLKYFTQETDIQMTLWGAKDREDYLSHIKTSINNFLGHKE